MTDLPRGLVVAGVVGVVLTAGLAALLECLLVPLYIGATIFPLAVLLAVASNILLPQLARSLVPRTSAAAAPFVAWLLVVIVFGAFARPEGDVILPGGGPGGVAWVTYGVMLGGALAGAVTLVVGSTPRSNVPSSSPARSAPRRAGDVSR